MYTPEEYDLVLNKLRLFFREAKGFVEVDGQKDLSILSACENPHSLVKFDFAGSSWSMSQTNQMRLEHYLLNNPEWKGCYSITTSYRDEKEEDMIEGRHLRAFTMFEVESHNGYDQLLKTLTELLSFLGFGEPQHLEYQAIANMFQSPTVEADHEMVIGKETPVAFLKNFNKASNPFFNMKQNGSTYKKCDVLLAPVGETIGCAERSTDVEEMRWNFLNQSDGKYAQTLFDKFGKDRVMAELDEYLDNDFFPRWGFGLGMMRLISAMKHQGLL
jgi:aspartyl/asparaginyl-tRNA synthetase